MPTSGRAVTTVIVGGGHNGLAMSKRLADRGIDHVVLERAEVASSWETQRWDSFTLLTPSWQTRLPGHAYAGEDPDGFMTGPEITEFIRGYAKAVAAPVHTGTTAASSSTQIRATGAAAPWCSPVVRATCRAGRSSPPPCQTRSPQ